MTHTTDTFEPLRADDPPFVAGYRLAARLGAGGMGRVYLSHTHGGRPVAIKVVRPELADDPGFRRRFSREIKAARRVRGAYTAELIDADAEGVPPWLATLYVPGPSLAQAVERGGPLPVPAVLWLMAGVAEALQAIHGAGIVHRDLKPSNVLLAADGPRVIDFGIALAADGTAHTATGAAIGTPQFMAPEQATAGDVTAATDVFALGQTAAFAALGRPLYGDGPSASVLYRIVHSEPDLTLLPEPLRELIGRCLAAEPGERITPAEVIAWCRRQLGPDAEVSGGPAVWREITGPEVTVPPPPTPWPAAPTVPHTHVLHPGAPYTRVLHPGAPYTQVLHPGAPHTRVLHPGARPLGPEERRARRRRIGLITSSAVVAGGVLLTGLTWSVMNAMDRLQDRERDREAAASVTPGATAAGSGQTGGSASGKASDADGASGSGATSSAGTEAGGETGAEAGSGTADGRSRSGRPTGVPYALVWLDAKQPVSLDDPNRSKGRKADIRLDCADGQCALESDTSDMLLVPGDPGATYETCRSLLGSSSGDGGRLPLAAAAAGSEICIKRRDGDLALMVIEVKSTAMPDIAFITADMTVWRAG
ncbi:protein kinase [Streptomyces sp. 15-116A]|uniref:protein kinase domain-containing protein n=1 Tax=Streptomyces sp. 15-116A TaxID=2259035 RepID=UPI0021B43C68|nr:protein kinase [Streptomyces sp. 15-116A]MCT7352774.1 protein kinase [Streptomyces sp. 15-116A]